MVTIRNERPADVAAREALLDLAYGPSRFSKPSQRLRNGRPAAEGLSFVAAENGRVIGTVRLWHVTAGGSRPALLLGPLAVHPGCRNRGIGSALLRRAIREAKARAHRAILLVGDLGFYGRLGFSAEKTGALWMPGRSERHRLLALELVPGALEGARGPIAVPGNRKPARPVLDNIVAAIRGGNRKLMPRAA
jgi:predicted N-acetyltransferase YhbS